PLRACPQLRDPDCLPAQAPSVSLPPHLEFQARSSSERLRAFEKNTTSPFFDKVPLWLPFCLGSKSGSKLSIGHGRIWSHIRVELERVTRLELATSTLARLHSTN